MQEPLQPLLTPAPPPLHRRRCTAAAALLLLLPPPLHKGRGPRRCRIVTAHMHDSEVPLVAGCVRPV
jgi:hypothetical protein